MTVEVSSATPGSFKFRRSESAATAPCQFARVPAQKFRSLLHVFLLTHSGSRIFVHTIEHFTNLPVIGRAADNCENPLAKFSRQSRDAKGRVSFERLPVQTPLTRNDDVDLLHL